MDLFELQAKLRLDDSSFNKGINAAEAAGQKLKGSMSAATVAIGNLAADMVRKGVNAITGVVNGAIDGYGNYQQLIGGVETLFKTSAGRVAAYAKQSYKTTGLSANDYMETVTSFSASLLQGLKGDTEAAADLANTAVTDMADNANKMGTDISSIQAAYMGFAKGNYTMLDNLKLGYGGTKGEMVRLINDSGILEKEIKDLDGITFDQMIAALHKVQENLGFTGTTAKEAASTISGSKESMKAAWQDLLTAVGGGGEEGLDLDQTIKNFSESFDTYFNNNLIPSVQDTIENSPKLITALANAITSIPPKSMAEAATSMTGVIEGAADGAKNLAEWVVDSLTATLDDININPKKVSSMGTAIGEFIGSTVADLVKAGPKVIPELFLAGANLAGSVIEGLFSGLMGADEGVYEAITDADKQMADSIRDANQSATKAHGILDYMDGLIKKYGEAAENSDEWAHALEDLEQVMPGATEKIEDQNGPLGETVQNLRTEVELMRLRAQEQAKEKALQDKREAYYAAVGDLETARTDLDIAYSTRMQAQQDLERYIKKYNPNADIQEIREGGNFVSAAQYALSEKSGLKEGSEEYKSAKAALEGISKSFTESDNTVQQLEGSIADLEQQVTYAQTRLNITEAALDKVSEAAGAAAQGLGNLSTVLYTRGDGDNAPSSEYHYDGDSSDPGVATGMEFVPRNGFRAELHRGEGVLTAAQNQQYRSGMGTSEIVGAIQEMRQDLQNLRLVVGTKTFGRAVVDYAASRVDGYIGQAESRAASGYGA